MMAHYGVDISSNNPHPINWQSVASYLKGLGNGAQPFVFVKVNQGIDYVNPYAKQDIIDAKAAGFAVGGYLMSVGGEDPNAQQTLYRSIVGSLPEAFDTELPNGVSTQQYIVETQQLLSLNPQALDYLNQSEEAEGFPNGSGLWLAEYNNDPNSSSFPNLIHQYQNQGTIPGASGIWDLNVWNGTDTQFNQFFGLTPTPTPQPTPQGEEMAVTPVITNFKAGQKDVFQVSQGVLYHKYESDANGKWFSEALAGPNGGSAFKPSLTFPAQTPQYVIAGGQILITVEDSRGFVFLFAQNASGPSAATWGVNQLP